MTALGPEWRALQREAQLAAEQIAQGVTALGRANHAQTGLYAQAFFGLSTGMERTGKLIFVADHAIRHDGDFPIDGDLRRIGHDLQALLLTCERIGNTLDTDRSFATRPADAIHRGIEDTLFEFAIRLRYYNLSHIAGAAGDQRDPIALWWEKVAAPICARHYSKKQQVKDAAKANLAERMFGDVSMVMHGTEGGAPINDVYTLFAHAGATRVVQKYGRLYSLQIVRWLASILWELSHRGAYEKRIEALLGLNEPFTMFLNDDKHLRERKTWSIYRL